MYESERWDGKGFPDGVGDEGIPLAVRIVHVAHDAAFQHTMGDAAFAADVVSRRAGGAFDPAVVAILVDDAVAILDVDPGTSPWESTLAQEPAPWSMLEGEEIDRALAAVGHFADLAVPALVGHSDGVAELGRAAAGLSSPDAGHGVTIHRAALVHDLGRVAVPVRIWEKADPLTADDWERVRLHAYHTERVLVRSPFLSGLATVASGHHERLDGSGYHRGVGAASLDPASRLLAAADAYHAMTEPRPHRPALSPEEAAKNLTEEAGAGRLAPEAVAVVLEAAGHRRPPVERPVGLTERETDVVALLARGLQTKQIGRRPGSRPRPPTITSRTPTARWESPPGPGPRCSPCSTASMPGRTPHRRRSRTAVGSPAAAKWELRMGEHVETVVVGGSQAGLAVGHCLRQRGRPFVILDAGERVGDAWRNRWDSLHLFTPGRYDAMPGMRFPGRPGVYPGKDEVADFLEDYAATFEFPVRLGAKVDRLARDAGGFEVSAGGESVSADNVVVATGAYHRQRIPSFASQLDVSIRQIRSTEYRNPAQLREGGVLVVGAGNSGAEIALDIAGDHSVWLSGPDTGQEPTRAGSIPTVCSRRCSGWGRPG